MHVRRFPGLRSELVSLLLSVAMLVPGTAGAAVPSPEFQKKVRAATFEVVVPKPAQDPVTYEFPLPDGLIPYAERTDAYWSIGSAVAIGPNTFVSASHVLATAVGRSGGPAAVRDSSGQVHAIDRILKYSMPEDYVVFSLASAPTGLVPLETSTSFAIDDLVFAVGNALGEGVVIRDGLLTSLTPEARDGRWKWLRFSAATSPGNSGGPLLDEQGRVIGIVVAKSPNENLNYALPIAQVLEGSTEKAVLENFQPFRLLMLRDPVLFDYRGEFPLPVTYAQYVERMLGAGAEYYRLVESKLLAEQAVSLFPRGDTAEFFASTHDQFNPALLAQNADGSWEFLDVGSGAESKLTGHGRVWIGSDPRVTLFRIVYPEGESDAMRYTDSKAFMDLLLKGLKVQRYLGSQRIGITSLGAAVQATTFTDDQGRVWQVRRWPLTINDGSVLVFALPTPDGYAGFAMQTAPALVQPTEFQMRTLANYFFVSFTGTLPQWRAYLGLRGLRAAVFDDIEISSDAASGVVFHSPRLSFDVPRSVIPIDDQSRLDVRMSYVARDDYLSWEPVGVSVKQAADKTSRVTLTRHSMPADGVSRELRTRWDQMNSRTADFSGIARRDESAGEYWARAVKSPRSGAGDVLYEIDYSTQDLASPREIEARLDQVVERLKFVEP